MAHSLSTQENGDSQREVLARVVAQAHFPGDEFDQPAHAPQDSDDPFAKLSYLGKSEHSDEELVENFLAGDMDAFSTIVERHRAKLLHVAKRYTRGNHDDAEDVVQDVLWKASKNLNTFRAEAKLSTWLHRMVMNAGWDFSHHRFRREHCLLDDDDARPDFDTRLAHDPRGGSEEALDLDSALARLSPEHRRALLAIDGAGYSMADLAEAEGVQVGTIKSRRARARAALLESLEASGIEV